MKNANPYLHVDRETAAKLNPFISEKRVDTLNNLSSGLDGLFDTLACDNFETMNANYLMSVVLTLKAALDYEAQQDEEPKPKEAPVTNVSKGRAGGDDAGSGAA